MKLNICPAKNLPNQITVPGQACVPPKWSPPSFGIWPSISHTSSSEVCQMKLPIYLHGAQSQRSYHWSVSPNHQKKYMLATYFNPNWFFLLYSFIFLIMINSKHTKVASLFPYLPQPTSLNHVIVYKLPNSIIPSVNIQVCISIRQKIPLSNHNHNT